MLSINIYKNGNKEALQEMKKLKLAKKIVQDFKKGIITKTFENKTFALSESEKKIILLFENKYSAKVYHLLQENNNTSKKTLTLFFVSQNENDFILNTKDSNVKYIMCYELSFEKKEVKKDFCTKKIKITNGIITKIKEN